MRRVLPYGKRFAKQGVAILLILLILSGVAMKYFSQSAAAAWYDENFAYRQGITVTVSSNSAEIKNLETLLTVDTSTLITAGKLQNNCQDLRFTSNQGKSLSYYIDSGCNTTTTKVWVMTDVIPANTTFYNLFMYYGNQSALAGTDSTKFTLFRGLVGYWAMNESANSWNGTSGEVKDFSVNGNNGTGSGFTSSAPSTSSKYGNAGVFDGSNDYVNVGDPANGSLDFGTNSFTVSSWFKNTTASSFIVNKTSGSSTAGYEILAGPGAAYGDIQFRIWDGPNVVATQQTIHGTNDNAWHMITAVVDRSTQIVTVYLDGVSRTTDNISTVGSVSNSANFEIGARGTNSFYNGSVDDTRVYNRPLSASEVTQLYSNPGTLASYSASSVTPTTSFATEEKAPQPVAVWSFEEGTGTTANDSTTNKNNATLVNMSSTPATNSGWMSEDMCVSGKCLAFDGINDRVNAGTNESLNITGAKTIELWFKETSTANVNQRLISKRQTTGGADTGGGNELTFNPSTGVLAYTHTGGNSASVTLTQFLNTWVHIAVSYDSATIRIYKNGILVASAAASQPSANSNPFMIGALANGLSPFSGFIDEVRMYPYTRSAAQIKADFATLGGSIGSSGVLGAASNNNMAALSNGLVGYWKMNEASWNGTASEVLDSSGAGNNGASVNGAGVSTGKFGNGGSMDGVDDYVNIPNNASWNNLSSMTYSLWIKPNSTTGTTGIMNARDGGTNGGFDLDNLNGTLRFATRISGGGSLLASGLVTGAWQHIVATYNNATKEMRLYKDGVLIGSGIASTSSGNTAQPLKIGNLTNMSVDDVRVYNRALSSADVSTLYNFAPGPVGYWNLDEKSGTTASDISGNGNTGTLTNGPQWTSGKVGGATNFDGTNDYVSIPDGGVADPLRMNNTTDLTIGAWVNIDNLAASGQHFILSKYSFNSHIGYSLLVNSNGTVRFDINGGTNSKTTTTTIAANKWYYITGVLSGGNIMTIYFNGIPQAAFSITSTTLSSYNAFFTIGSPSDNPGNDGYSLSGKIDEVKVYNYARTQKQVVEDMNGNHSAVMAARTGSMVGYWDFDEGYGTVSNDLSGNGNRGTLTNMSTAPSTSTSGWSNNGKFNKAINFDGSNDVISVGNQPSLNSTNAITLSAWINPTTFHTGNTDNVILSKYDDALSQRGYLMYLDSSGQIKTEMSQSCASTNSITLNSGYAASTNAWTHVVTTYDGSNMTTYVNGLKKATVSGPASICASTAGFLIGGRYGGGSTARYFSGAIDEVKIYNYALTSDDVKRDYNRGASQQFGSTGTTAAGVNDNSSDRMYCPPGDSTGTCGPVGEWNFEEGQGSTVNDTSGNGNSGTWNGTGAAHYVAGKVGKGGGFDGSTDYVSVPDSSSLNVSTNFTVSGWVKNVNGVGTPVIYDSGTQANRWFFSLNSGKLNITERSIANNTATTTLDNNWHHVAVVKNGDTGANVTFYLDGKPDGTASIGTVTTPSGTKNIGKWTENGSLYWNGGIDQLKVYNYARSTAQIAWDYNRGGPVAQWDMDECQGNVIHDLSGNGNDGTVTIGATGTQTSLGTCTTSSTAWGNGVSGKLNSSLNLDGTDDYATITPRTTVSSANATISLWAYPTSSTVNNYLFDSGTTSNQFNLIWYPANATYKGFAGHFGSGSTWATSPAVAAINTWHHVVITSNGTNTKLYVDGKQLSSVAMDTATTPTIWKIGSTSSSNYFSGKIDDVRVYNYGLTAQQVQTLYTGGAVRFGPAVGTP